MKNVTYISAGAGSGKTFTLTRILSEMLSGKDNMGKQIPIVAPSQVILTTFTELAASEFREKARKKLLEVDNLDAAAQIDSACIGTVHSVALHFIKKFWYLLGYGADVQTISERDQDFYMSQSLARIVSEHDGLGNLKKQKELDAFRKFRDYYDIVDGFGHPNYLFWQDHLRDVVEKMEYYNVTDVKTSIVESLKTAESIFDAPAKSKEDLLAYLRIYYNYIVNNTTKAAVGQKTVIKPLINHCENAHELLVLISTMATPVGGPTKIESDCPEYGKFMNDLKDVSISESDLLVLKPYIESVFTLAKEWRDDYVKYKETKHIISYNDMERLFLHLITKEQEVMDYISNNFRLVMVDEFQDSNPVQLKIFNQLSELISPEGHSYWVGDPKQAIYGFRGADTDLVNSVSKHFKFYNDKEIHQEEGKNHLGSGRLTECWRSRKILVDLVNAVFKDKFQHIDGNGNVVHDIDPLCITLEPHFKVDNLKIPALVHWHNDKKRNQQKVKPEALAWKVKQLLDEGWSVHSGEQDKEPTPIRPKDIAILCRKNDTIKEIVKAMRKFNIPVSEAEDAIIQRIEVQLVISLLHFVQNPTNKHVIADLMRLLWGKNTEDILKDRMKYILDKDNDDKYLHLDEDGKLIDDKWKEDCDQVKNLVKLTERFKHMSIPEMVKALVYECDLPALTSRWGDNKIRLQNLTTVIHLAEDYDQMCLQMGLGTSISGFVYYLNSTEPDKEKDNHSDTVKVFTYHGSKGLEWPVVILNELNENSLDPGTLIKKSFMRVREVVLKDKSSEKAPFDKEYFLHFFPYIIKGANGKPTATMIEKIKKLDFYKNLETRVKNEEKRLLYVGMTRAKDCLYTTGISEVFAWLDNVGIVPNTEKNASGNSQNETTNDGSLKFMDVWKIPDYISRREDIEVPGEDEIINSSPQYDIPQKPSQHQEFEDRYLSPSKIESFEGYNACKLLDDKQETINTQGWGNDYSNIGSCIHDIFAVYKKGWEDANRKAASSIISGYGLSGSIKNDDEILNSADWLYEILQKNYPQKEGDRIEREVPFMMTLSDGRILRGEIDLLWHYTDNLGKKCCVLVDYKSYMGKDFEGHTKKYYAQLSAYARALKNADINVSHALIYFPVHYRIHELE